MDAYGMMHWSRRYEVLANRVGIVNELLGCRYHHDRSNPMVIVMHDGGYSVKFYGDAIAAFRMYDEEGLEDAIGVLDSWQDCIWMLSRKRHIKRVYIQDGSVAV